MRAAELEALLERERDDAKDASEFNNDWPLRLSHWIVAGTILTHRRVESTPLMTSLLLSAKGKKTGPSFCKCMFDVLHSIGRFPSPLLLM